MGNFVPFRFDLEIKVNSCYFFICGLKCIQNYSNLQKMKKNRKLWQLN